MAVLLPALAGVLGAVVGSFLNVVIHRVPAGLSVVRPPSACPACSSPVRAYDNVPVLSWLVLRAKCRDCGAPISARYPLVELGTAAAFVVVAAILGPQLVLGTAVLPLIAELVVLLALLYLAAVSIALAAIDLDVHRLPNSIVLPAYLVGGVALTVAAIAAGEGFRYLKAPVTCITTRDLPIAYSPPLETAMIPDAARIADGIRTIMKERAA